MILRLQDLVPLFLFIFNVQLKIMKDKIFVLIPLLMFSCTVSERNEEFVSEKENVPFYWEGATVYFLLTDRFYNGDSTNDFSFDRKRDGARLRNFMGGDIAGIIKKIEEGYFNKLGINVIWLTPPLEQLHGSTDEGTGTTYGYHGYWTYDWTAIDPNFGTWDDLKEMVDVAHKNGIRVIMDVVLNHTGPVIPEEPAWPDAWVRTSPICTFNDFESTVSCTLVENLPDIRTEKNQAVELPAFLMDKWEGEGRLDKEINELEAFFTRTRYPRAPRYYIIKWLTDFIRKLGIDGFRVDTAKHVEPEVWQELWEQAIMAFREWKTLHPEMVMDDRDFFMVGEVFGFNIQEAPFYNYGDSLVNFYKYGFRGLINFSFKTDAEKTPEEIFSFYSDKLHGEMKGNCIMNYVSSHDDSEPFDRHRSRVFESATKLLLAPGMAQIYYGDETARPLIIDGTQGDATLRSMMNWEALDKNVSREDYTTGEVFNHWSKLSHFRKDHVAVGAGLHHMIHDSPYTFTRTYEKGSFSDKILVIIDPMSDIIQVEGIFSEGMGIKDYYSGQTAQVKNGILNFDSLGQLVLLGKPLE
jgi:alpha-amylase